LRRRASYVPVKIIRGPAEAGGVPLVRKNHRRGNPRLLEQPGQVTQTIYRWVAFSCAVTAITGETSPVEKYLVTPGEALVGPVDAVVCRS
jgi:hypothetical protein